MSNIDTVEKLRYRAQHTKRWHERSLLPPLFARSKARTTAETAALGLKKVSGGHDIRRASDEREDKIKLLARFI
jgi:hypothetical protein